MELTGLAVVLGRMTQLQQTLERLQGVTSQSTGAQAPVSPETSMPSFAQTLASARGLVARSNSQNTRNSATKFDTLITQTAERYGVDTDLVHAVVQAESAYDPHCRSRAGAMGLMQLMPGTAAGLGVNPQDPAQNLDGGVRYLRQQLDRFKEVDLALAAYNAGPGAVQRYHGVPPFRETQEYVRRVLQTLWQRKGE